MNGASALSMERGNTACRENVWAGRIEIDPGRVATWTLIFTNTFFVTYFLGKLFRLM